MGRFVGLRLPEEKPKKDTKKPDDGSVDEKAEKPKKEEKKPEK